MIQPEALKKDEPLLWSAGKGTDVWAMFSAAIAGDLEAIKRLVGRDASLVRCHYAYRTPLYFAVRENRSEVAAFLLSERSGLMTGSIIDFDQSVVGTHEK